MKELQKEHHRGPTQQQYLIVFGLLALLTLATAGFSYLKIPEADKMTIAMTISVIKASLVLSIFMHLRYEKRWVKWIFLASVILALIFMAGSAGDYVPGIKRLCGI